MNHYETLGVSRNADREEIRKAYRSLAMKHHPDRGGKEEDFKRINQAHAVLSDDQRRSAYDAELDGTANTGFSFSHQGFGNAGMDEIFRQFFQTGHFTQARRNRDIKVGINLTLESTLEPQRKIIAVTKSDGSSEDLDVTIPRGVSHNSTIRYPGLGDHMFQNLPRGDLYIQVQLFPHPDYQVFGKDVEKTVTISAWNAMLGGEIEVTGLDDRRFCVQVPAGCQPGTKLRISEQGVYGTSDQRGDLYLQIRVEIPRLTEFQRTLVNQWVNTETTP